MYTFHTYVYIVHTFLKYMTVYADAYCYLFSRTLNSPYVTDAKIQTSENSGPESFCKCILFFFLCFMPALFPQRNFHFSVLAYRILRPSEFLSLTIIALIYSAGRLPLPLPFIASGVTWGSKHNSVLSELLFFTTSLCSLSVLTSWPWWMLSYTLFPSA